MHFEKALNYACNPCTQVIIIYIITELKNTKLSKNNNIQNSYKLSKCSYAELRLVVHPGGVRILSAETGSCGLFPNLLKLRMQSVHTSHNNLHYN